MRPIFVLTLFMIASSAAMAAEIQSSSVLAQMNAAREREGLDPLAVDERLSLAAEDRMRDMEEQGYWAHQLPGGVSPFVWVRRHGFAFDVAGENLARGFETAEIMVEAWLESPGHRANLLSADYTRCGISIIDGYTTGRATGRSVVVIFARESVDAE